MPDSFSFPDQPPIAGFQFYSRFGARSETSLAGPSRVPLDRSRVIRFPLAIPTISEGQAVMLLDPVRVGKVRLESLCSPDCSSCLYSAGEMENRVDEACLCQHPSTKKENRRVTSLGSGFSREQTQFVETRPHPLELNNLGRPSAVGPEARRAASEVEPADYPRVPAIPVRARLSVRLHEPIRGGRKWLQKGDSFSHFCL